MEHICPRASDYEQACHAAAHLHHLHRHTQQEKPGVQRHEAGGISSLLRAAVAPRCGVAVQHIRLRLLGWHSVECVVLYGGVACRRYPCARITRQRVEVPKRRSSEGPFQLREREFRAGNRSGGEQVFGEYPYALLPQGKVPQGVCVNFQSVQRDVGGGNAGFGQDVFNHRAVYPPALREGFCYGHI